MKYESVLHALLVPMTAVVAPVYAADFFTTEQVQRELFPQASHFEDHTLSFSKEQRKLIKHRAGTRQRNDTQAVWRALNGSELLGWVIVDDVIGKHEFITYAVAVSPAGEVIGLEIMSYRETKGGEVREASWRNEFKGKTLDDTLRLGKDISNISGATLSCRNLTDGVKRLLVIWDIALREV